MHSSMKLRFAQAWQLDPASSRDKAVALVRDDVWGYTRRIILNLTLITLCLIAPPCHAMTPSSLFFTEDEVRQIEELVQKKPQVFAPIGKHQLHLGTILFYGPANWSVWLQNEKWTPETTKPNMQLIEVTADYVKLRVTPFDGQAPMEATLRPHQSLNLLTGAIAEGR